MLGRRNSRRNRQSLTSQCARTRRLQFEPLEDRRLLAITVDTLLDQADGPANGISLRDAIQMAPVNETINFAPDLTGVISLTLGQLTINRSLTINGPGAELLTIDASARDLTARGNLVAVITNGTAVLGLGAIGPLAAKPVMEGKGVLFKKFAGMDVFDIELAERDPEKLVDIIASLEPTFGGINLEDIKAPECFLVERKLRARMKIPVFHDDQHGTAIIVAAALLNGLKVVDKDIARVKLVVSGAAPWVLPKV